LASTHGIHVIDWNGDDSLERLVPDEGAPRDPHIERIRAICDHQFGTGAADALLSGTKIDLRVSNNTGKVRNVTVDGEHVLSLRAEDGFFTLKIAGARRLHKAFVFPRLRVVVSKDSAEFNKNGKNVFAQFVEKWDATLRPGEECLIVTWSDELVACGQMHLAPSELGFFKKGLAVHTRDGTQ
jgi:7-cyano-7-deazaguanine tRNA-ribosyltransferase